MMSRDEELVHLIESYEALAAIQDAAADHIATEAEREGWHDDLTQAADMLRNQAKTNRALAQEVRDGVEM
jgi:hypothetical protein